MREAQSRQNFPRAAFDERGEFCADAVPFVKRADGEAGKFRATTDSFPDIWAVDLKPVVTFSGKSKKQKKGKAK